MKEYDYTLNGKFNTNDDWVETAHGLKELRFVLKKIKDNPTAREWTLTRDDHPRQTLYTNEDGYALIDMLDTVEELGSDALDSDKWNMLTTLTDEDRISMNVNGLDIQLANGLCPVDTGDLEDCDWNVLDAQTCDSYSPERKPDQNNFPERQPL